MFAVKIAFLATAACLLATETQGEITAELLDLVGLFPSTYDYSGRAFTGAKENANFLNEEDQRLVDMAENLIDEDEELEVEEIEEEGEKAEIEEEEEGKFRAVTTNLTASQIGNALVAATKAELKDLKWDVSKRFQNQYTDVPYKAGGKDKNMRVSLSDGTITGLGSLKRESSSLNRKTNTLKMRMGLRNVYVDGNYQSSVTKEGAAPANNAAGHVQDKLSHAWIDAQVRVDSNGIPVNIQSFEANSVDPLLTQVTNIDGNKYGPMYKTAFSEALRQITLNMMESNLKVQFNQALQGIKDAGNYDEWL